MILFYSPLVSKAISLAVRYHHSQIRKGDGQAYIVHPVDVALMLARAGYSEHVIAAGLCHDLLEDTACTPQELREALGDEVLLLVQDVSEEDKSLSWEVRKERHLEHLRHASHEAMAIAAADKIHNLESMYAGYRASGRAFFEPFKRDVHTTLVQARRVYVAISEGYPECPLLPTYEAALTQLENAVS